MEFEYIYNIFVVMCNVIFFGIMIHSILKDEWARACFFLLIFQTTMTFPVLK